MINRKSNNTQFEIYGEYLHIYDTLTEIVNNEQTEYEGELYVIQTDLTESVIESNYNHAFILAENQRAGKIMFTHKRPCSSIS